jgi:hypothetical protein
MERIMNFIISLQKGTQGEEGKAKKRNTGKDTLEQHGLAP